MKRITILTLTALLLAGLVQVGPAQANDISEKWGLGATFGEMKLVGGQNDYSNVDQNFGLWYRAGLTPRWSLDAAFRFGYVRPGVTTPGEDAGLTFDSSHAFYTNIMHGTLGVRYHFAPDRRFAPYAGLHAGFLDFRVRDEGGNSDVALIPDGEIVVGYDESGRRNDLSSAHLTLGATLGTEFFFSDAVSMDLALRYSQLLDNSLDNIGASVFWGPDHTDANDGLVEAFVGLTFYFGGNSDKDDDGIPNENDACPEVPEDMDGFQDEDGCPELDNDGDGLNDDCDQCPDQPEDMDGFQDEDGCPDPDNDGDGVIDASDSCPETAEDMDGFQDEDGCPDPDNDGDGVLDAQDRCPGTPQGIAVDANGCPLVEEIRAELVLEGVTFASGKAELKSESFAVLDRVATSLIAWPLVEIEIQGHTDSTGGAEMNRQLSARRAEAVRDYLMLKGVAGHRMTAVGYGEDDPIANNNTREGRAMNRRVALVRMDKTE